MKKILLLTALCASTILHAQNWKPLNLQEKFNYTHNNAGYITHFIWATSSEIVNGDSLYQLNRVVDVYEPIPEYMTIDGSQFLMREMLFTEQGLIRFQNEDTFNILSHAEIGETWNFNDDGMTAEIVGKIPVSIFGESDSIKTIVLSSNDTIIISKNHGIVRFPDFEGGKYMLVGIEGRDLGMIEPKFPEFFDFEVGDVFQYFEVEYDYYDQYEYTFKSTIAAISGTEYSMVVFVDNIGFKDYFEYDGMNSTYLYTEYLTGSDTLTFVNNSNHQTNQYPNIHYEHNGYGIIGNKLNDLNIYSKGFNCTTGNMYQLENGGILTPLLGGFYAFEYSIGLGLTRYRNSGCSYAFERNLVGFVKDGDTTGTVYSNSYLLSRDRIALNQEFKVFPNPSNAVIHLQNIAIGTNITIFNANGQIVKRLNVNCKDEIINIEHLPSGIYLIKAENESNANCLKFIKN